MSIIFFGTPEFAVPSLAALIRSNEDIGPVITQPDKRQGRGRILTPPPVKLAALDAGLKVMQPEGLKDEVFIERLTSLRPEFIVVVAYGKILPKSILDLPEKGCINVHASLLPKYRGAAPIAWAIIRGEKRTGVTSMLMDEGLDTGPILLSREIDIDGEDTAGSLGKKLSVLGASLLTETLNGMRNRSIKPIPQTGETSYAPPLRKEDGLIDWSKRAAEISDFIHGMLPWPGAYCHMEGERVNVLKAAPLQGKAGAGDIVRIGKDGITVGTGDGLLSISELQPSGKKPMSASAFVQGRKLKEGMSIQ